MKKIFYLFVAFASVSLASTVVSCRFAHRPVDGDTVAASVFEPEDTAMLRAKAAAKASKATRAVADSVGMYYIGDGSSRSTLQLVSYPSRRDTVEYGKTRHVKVKGCADIGHVVRVSFRVSKSGKDSLVCAVEEISFAKK